MAIDFYEKEVEKLRIRFNKAYGTRSVFDLQSRNATVMTICRAGMLVRCIRQTFDANQIGAISQEFYRIRKGLNRFFDQMESQQGRMRHRKTGERQNIAANG